MLSREKPFVDWNQTFRPPIWYLENCMSKKIWRTSFKKFVQKRFRQTFQCVMPSKEKSLLTEFKPLELDLASRELHGEQNLKELIQETTSNIPCIAPCFRKRSHFLIEFKPLQLEPGNSRNAWRRKFERISSRNYFKSTSNRLCTAPYLWERSYFLLKINLQSSIFFSI